MLTTYARIYGSVLAFFLTVSAARAGAEDYRFDLVSTDHRFGSGAIVEVRWTDLRTGAAVEGAVIFATRMDMAPEGMAMMTSPVTAMAADVPGNYRFATDLTMAGGWRHPDGVPEWSDRETVTADGRAFLPVRASEDISLDPAAEPAPPDGGERGILYYRNPMGLPDTSPVPKQDSMGMDYIAVYTGEGSDDGSITVSPGKLQRTGVRTSEAVLAPLAASLRAPGRVVLDERKVSVISLRADAFIETVADVTTGSTIAEGAPLVTLYAPEIAQALALFVADVRTGARQGDGARQRLENLGVPGEVIDRITAEGLASVSIPIMAPRSGVVLERMAVEGMMPEAGETLFRIADISTVWVIAEVPEAALMEITTGTEARISFRGLGGAAMTGRIETIYPELDMTTRTGKLRIELPNPDGRLRANMFAEVEIMLGQTPVVQVPEGAVIDTGVRQVVILDLGEGRFRPTPVVVGRRGGGRVEIVSGVAAGDRVVSTATFLIDAESNLNAALAAVSSPGSAPESNP